MTSRICPNCGGSGQETRQHPKTGVTETITCRTCHGKGTVGK